MRDELLAYLLNDLDDEQRSRVEAKLESDPIWRHELERLRSYVDEAREPSDEPAAVPDDLVSRTCSFVKEASARGALSPAVLPASLTEAQDTPATRRKRWTLVDFAVVGSILVVMGTLLVPALRESRDAARRLQCQEKLRAIGFALGFYAEQSGGQLPAIGRNENAGMYALKLVESGVLTEEQMVELLACPSTQLADDIHRGVVVLRIPTRLELAKSSGPQLQTLRKLMGGSFAYRVGYVDTKGRYRQIQFTGRSNAPLMADKPSDQLVGFQSANHGGCGQNVLFQDFSARYVYLCRQEGQDQHWYLNEQGHPAAGTHKNDVVMMSSELRPLDRYAMSDE